MSTYEPSGGTNTPPASTRLHDDRVIDRGIDGQITDDVVVQPGTATRGMRTTGYAGGETHFEYERDRVQWGPIIAGVLTNFAVLALLTVLGLAIGASVLESVADGSDVGIAAGIWGAASLAIAYFVGGWIAAKTAAVEGPGAGLINGFLVAATGIAVLAIASATGLGNLLGSLGTEFSEISDIGSGDTATEAFTDAEEGAWGTLGVLALALGAGALGGYIGHNKREDVMRPADLPRV